MEQITRQTEQPAATAVSTSDIVKERLDKDTNASCEFKQGFVIIATIELHTHFDINCTSQGFLFKCL